MRYILFTALLFAITIARSQDTDNQPLPFQKRVQLPYNRILQPAGKQVVFGSDYLENHAMDAALSPDGKWLAVQERYSIVFISTRDNRVEYVLANNDNPDLKGAMNTYSGITWYNGADGLQLYWSAATGSNRSYVVSAGWNGQEAYFIRMFSYNAVTPAATALPNEIIINREKNKEYLYVVLNGNNQLLKQDLESGKIIWAAETGVAPYGLTMAAGKIYVTNWAGRKPLKNDRDVAGVPWGLARVDSINGSTREGSVSVIDPTDGRVVDEIIVGLHPNEIISDRRGRYIYITNSNSDNISVINTATGEVTETISVRLQPDINPFFGDSPNGLCLSPDEKTLYVANGMDNAIAVISLGEKSSERGIKGESILTGFIPTGAYPSSVTVSKSKIIYVTNLEGMGVHLGITNPGTSSLAYNSHRMLASVSVIPQPGIKQLSAYTDTVVAVNNLSRASESMLEPRESAAALPLPERIGEPSLFRHVVYIIKENRTYDQLLGDMEQGDGDPDLCIYGREITPNTHKLAEEFILLDNYYVSGKCSAEGHQWTDAAIVTDYIEKNMRAWFRSYPHVQEDALVYSPTGFLWDNATSKGKTVRIYGEASVPVFPRKVTWTEIYDDFLEGKMPEFQNHTTIEPVREILSQTYPAYGHHEVPDILRADAFIKELEAYEAMEGDQLPELMILALPNDHTAGTRPGFPTPRAMVADNDLALGLIVEAISKSRFWENTVIFVTEDDSQNGWDHVSAYRTVGLVISPYSRLRSTNHTYYAQPSLVRTIEQILGLPPMNIQDAIANPMANCFTGEKNLAPFQAVPNNIPLNEMNPDLSLLSGRALHFARKSLLPEFDGIDSGNDDLLNRILWFAARGNSPYPSRFEGSGDKEEEEEEYR